MVNTTNLYWSANGVSLQTLAQNIETLGGRFSPPPLRGDDTLIPYKAGEVFEKKQVGARVIPFGMWVRGTDENGSEPGYSPLLFQDNWRKLRNLLWNPSKQFDLQKRFWYNNVIRSATAKAQYNAGLEPTMHGPKMGKFTVDLKLTDPFFYDDELLTFNLANGNNVINVPGDWETRRITIVINGSRTNTIIRNTSLDNPVQVEYHGVLATGASATIDIDKYASLTSQSGIPSFDSSSLIRHTGEAHWLALQPGNNTINVSSSAGAGAIQLQARGAWI